MNDGPDNSEQSIELPESLSKIISEFKAVNTTTIDLNVPDITDENVEYYVGMLLKQYIEKANKKALHNIAKLQFENVNPKHQEKIAALYEEALYKTLEQTCEELEPLKKDRESMIDWHTNLYSKDISIINELLELEVDENRAQSIDKASRRFMQNQLSYVVGDGGLSSEQVSVRSSIKKGLHNKPGGKLFFEEKKRYHLMKAAKDIKAIYHNTNNQKPLWYMIQYAGYKQWALGRGIGMKKIHMEEEIRLAYSDWIQNRIRYESILELSKQFDTPIKPEDINLNEVDFEIPEDLTTIDFESVQETFDFIDDEKKEAFFNSVYAKYYQEHLKSKRTGTLDLLPIDYAALAYPDEMMKASLNFLSQGFWNTPLKTLNISYKNANGRADRLVFDIDAYMVPLIDHAKQGKPLPFSAITINHGYHAKNLYQRCIELANQVADHPGDYHKLELIDVLAVQDYPADAKHVASFEQYLDQMIELASRQDKPLACDLRLKHVVDFYRMQYAEKNHDGIEISQSQAKLVEDLKRTLDKVDNLQRLIAINRRKLNYEILNKGEGVVGRLSEFEVEGQKPKLATSKQDIRSCKRNSDLTSALQGASMEMEMEEEEEQAKSKEKAQEKEMGKEEEQESELEQAHGDPATNLTSAQEFIAYAKREFQGFHGKEEPLKELWNQVMGHVSLESGQDRLNPKTKAMSESLAREILKDPDAFRYGLVHQNLPQGFCMGQLNTKHGLQGGLYYNPSKELKVNPLTAKVHEPIEVRPRKDINASQFLVKERPTSSANPIERMKNKAVEKIFEPLTREEIGQYNQGHLSQDQQGKIVASKMLYTTSKIGPLEFQAWAMSDSIATDILDNLPPQEIAEIAANFGGQAMFDLTDELHKLKDACSQHGHKSWFKPFMEHYILQKDNDSLGEKRSLGDRVLTHAQFKTLKKIRGLKKDEFLWFMAFASEHAKYHAQVDLEELYDSFQAFSLKVKELNGNKPLPTKDVEKLAQGCKNMKVALNRAQTMLEIANQHGLLEEQLGCLTQLDLNGQTCHQAMQVHGYHIVTPLMGINPETIKQHPIPTKASLGGLQAQALNQYFNNGGDIKQLKSLFYTQYALSEPTCDFDTLKSIENQILSIKGKQHPNHKQTQAYLFTCLGFCLFNPSGKQDLLDEEQLQKFIKPIQNHDFNHEAASIRLSQTIQKLIACQSDYLQAPNQYQPPTMSSFTTTLETFLKLNEANLLEASFDVHQFYQQSGRLFEAIHQNQSRDNQHSLQHLADVLNNLGNRAKQNPDFAKLQGSLLKISLACNDSSDDYSQKIANLYKTIDESYCKDSVQRKNITKLLSMLEGLDWQSIADEPPSVEQLTSLLEKAAKSPQPSAQAWAKWVKTQPGFEHVSIEVKLELSDAQSYQSIYEEAKPQILALMPELDYNPLQIDTLSHVLKTLDEGSYELEDETKLINLLKQVAYDSHHSAVAFQKQQHLKALDDPQANQLLEQYLSQQPFKDESLDTFEQLHDYSLSSQAYHQDMANYFKQINYIQDEGLAQTFQDVTAVNLSGVPIESFTELLDICATSHQLSSDKSEEREYPSQILQAVIETKPLSAIQDWSSLNHLIKHDIINHEYCEPETTMKCLIQLAVHDVLDKTQAKAFIQISETHPDLSVALNLAIIKALNQHQDVELAKINQSIQTLISHNIEKLDQFITNLGDISLLPELAKVAAYDAEHCQMMMRILERTCQSSPNYTSSDLIDCLEELKDLDTPALLGLATMDLDAPYPDLVDLRQGIHQLATEPNYQVKDFAQSLQKSFFEDKNSEKMLSRLFDDARVVGVVNECNNLDFTEPVGLSGVEKQQLLSDYAYIHAIGKDIPVHDGKAMKDLTKSELKELLDSLKLTINDNQSSEQQKHLAMLQLIAASREIYFRATGKFPYSTQITSLLNALQNGDMNINEIATGQGKSLTAALYATVLWAQNKPVVICTSNLTLASEGLEENSQYFEYMGIPTQLIKAQSKGSDFQHKGINYSDVSNMALYLAKTDIQNTLRMSNPGLVLDEVDFTVLDEVTDYRFAVSLNEQKFGPDVNPDEWFYYQLNKFVDSDLFLNSGVDRESDIINAISFLQEQLIEASKPGDEGIHYPPGEHKLTEPLLSYVQDRIAEFQRPGSEARKLLDTWIDSAFNANLIYKEGQGKAWVLESFYKDGKKHSAARIISHHRVAKGSKWSKGVHQFVHARINSMLHDKDNRPDWAQDKSLGPCLIDIEKAHVAAFSSKNFVDYFTRRGGLVWGMTGTIGSSEERAELIRKYRFKLTQIATHQTRQAKLLDPVFASNSKGHVQAVYSQIKQHAIDKNKMPTVVVEEDAKYAAEFKTKFLKKLQDKASKTDDPPRLQFYNGIDYEFYTYNSQTRKYEKQDSLEVYNEHTKQNETILLDGFEDNEAKEDFIKKQAGVYNTISITTPMMGRGTDFKPKSKDGLHDHEDGLFVIGAYVDASEREQRQIVGRMGRQGKKGLFVNCVNVNRFVSKLKEEGFDVPKSVQYFKPTTLSKKFKPYRKTKNMNLAKERLLKQTFGDIRSEYYMKFIGMLQSVKSEEGFDEIQAILENVPGFNKDKFQAEYSADLMKLWNKFLVKIDKQYILLRDQHDGDADKIFEELHEYSQALWQTTVIDAMGRNFGFKDDKAQQARAELYFSDYIHYQEHELDQYAKHQAQKAALIQAKKQNKENLKLNLHDKAVTFVPDGFFVSAVSNLKPEEYQEAFDEIHSKAVIERILRGSKGQQAKDPDLSVRQDLQMPVINYQLWVYQKEPARLDGSDQPEKDLAAVMCIELINQIAQTNNLIAHEKRFDSEEIDLGALFDCEKDEPQATQKAVLDKIKQDPIQCFEVLNQAWLNKLQLQSNLSKQHGCQVDVYQQHLKQAQDRFDTTLKQLEQHCPNLTEQFTKLNNSRARQLKQSASHAYQTLTRETRKQDPKQALQRRLENPEIAYQPYDMQTLLDEINLDIKAYLSDKSKWSKRKTAAKELEIQLSFCKTPEAVMKVLSNARMKAMAKDVKKSSIFRTRNVKGSRFQDLINRSFERIIIQNQDPMTLLNCAHTLRVEMIEQFQYLGETLIGDKAFFMDNMRELGYLEDGEYKDINLKELNDIVQSLSLNLKTLQAKKIKSAKAKAALHLMENNLEVLLDLEKKMQAVSIELGSDKIMISSSAQVREQSFKQSSIVNHLKTIVHLRGDILSDETSSEVKRKIFSKEGGMPLPTDRLGDAANLFRLHAKTQYGPPDHMWGPELTDKKVEVLYDVFQLLDSDLTSDPAWDTMWRQHKAQLMSTLSEEDAQAKVAILQAQILSAYRFHVISKTHFIEKNPNESKQEYHLREARCKNYIQQVSKAYIKYPSKQGYQKLHDSYQQKLQSEVEQVTQWVAKAIAQGKPIGDACNMLGEKLSRLKSSFLVEYLGERESQGILKPLQSQHDHMQAFVNLLDKNLDNIALGFLPGDKHTVQTRVIDLIQDSVKTIMASPEYAHMGKLGQVALKSHLSSKESIQRVYQMAVDARTEHFAKMLPQDMQKLLNDKQEGLEWIRYPRARREVMANLAQIILSDSNKYKQDETQLEHFLSLQQAYIKTIEEDLQSMSKSDALAMLDRISGKEILQVPNGMDSNQANQLQKELTETFTRFIKMANERPILAQVPEIFSDKAHTGLDISVGLLQELEKTIKEVEKVNEKPSVEVQNESQNEEIAKTFDEAFENHFKETEHEIYSDSQKSTLTELKSILFNEQEQFNVKRIILDISDPDERLCKIQSLFQEAIKPIEDCTMQDKYSQSFKENYQQNQARAVVMLQNLWVDTIEAQCIAMANDEMGLSSDELPEALSSEAKSNIYSEVLSKAKDSPIIKSDIAQENGLRCSQKLDQVMYSIESLSEDVTQVKKSSSRLR